MTSYQGVIFAQHMQAIEWQLHLNRNKVQAEEDDFRFSKSIQRLSVCNLVGEEAFNPDPYLVLYKYSIPVY